jgi:hypothetical protein
MPEKKIQDLLKTLEQAISNFNSSLDVIQSDISAEVELIAKQIDLTGQYIKPTVNNLKLINQLKAQVDKAVITPEYEQKVIDFGKAFNEVEKIQNEYFALLVEEYTAPLVVKEMKNLAISETVESLTQSGIRVNVSDKISDILKTNIESGSRYSDMLKEVKTFIQGNEETLGGLERYASQITTDSINQYSATYSNMVSEDLGLEWSIYVGSLVEKSRDVCIELVHKKFLHKSEIPGVLKGKIGEKTIPLYHKTGLPYGMISGTNPENFKIRRGGNKCNHLLMPITEERVPQNIKDKINA